MVDEFNSKRNEYYGKCANCERYNTSFAWCQTCDPQKIVQEWTSGNKEIDNCITEYQLKTKEYEEVIEWIPFNRIVNIQNVGDKVLATWLDGICYVKREIVDNKYKYTQSRTPACSITLKILSRTQNNPNILKEFKNHVQLKNQLMRVYGLTQNIITNEYMLVFDEFSSMRYEHNGTCANCKRYNTSYAWCQTCDPWKTAQGWTSGNKDIDNCIKEFQLKAKEYDNLIEWIPFNKLVNIQNIGDKVLANWLDGIRIISGGYGKYTQSRIPSYKVELKILTRTQSLIDTLNEFVDYVQLKNDELKVYGLTQNIATNEYILVFDEFGSKRSEYNGKCANCKRYNTDYAWCQTCDPWKTAQGWTSGNKDVDDCIKEIQLKATKYDDIIEWIPFNRLDDIQVIGDRVLATWLDGIRYLSYKYDFNKHRDEYEHRYTQSRTSASIITLKTLTHSQNDLKQLMSQLEDKSVYGLTQNIATNEYMLVFDEFYNKRDKENGTCTNCNRYNTSRGWCQTCDLQKTTEGWTSGNKDIDDCIKEFQLMATKYEDVIEWIPFNRLDHIQIIGDKVLATWLDGIRIISGGYGKYTQSRIPSCKMELKILTQLQNLINGLKELKKHAQSVNKNLCGLTQNTITNDYMLVFSEFDEFISMRYEPYGKCANCKRYNTSEVWCQTCDPQKSTQGWTSGNNDVDDCIKEIQLKATSYNNVIEWISFNRLDDIQIIGDRVLATWLDGIRYIKHERVDNKYKYTHSRIPSYKVELKTLTRTPSLLDMLNEFVDYVQLKNSVLKVYGLTQNTSTNEYMLVFDEFYNKREDWNGKCANCNRNNTSLTWCQTCDPQKTAQGWTSENKDIDDCIKEFQLKATKYDDVIEWIPFNRLVNVQIIGKGGFGSVFSATWLDGKRIALDINSSNCTQSRTPSCVVALKTLPDSQSNFLREFKNYIEFRLAGNNLEVYGLTQDTTNNEYLMVFQYANRGSLHNFLSLNFKDLNWKSKLKQLVDISENLSKVHKSEYVHGDFHSGNILQNQYISGDLISYIADLGLSRKKDESDLENCVYGVLPYVAPEVLTKQPYSIAADIYSFGIIMTEVSTGRPPHVDIEYDNTLAIMICNGLRPDCAKDTPECYIRLANQCMNANPSDRPTASDIYSELWKWYNVLNNGSAENKDELAILKAFQSADAIIPTLSTELPIFPKDKLTSKMLNFKNLSKPINSSELLKVYGSRECEVSIPDDHYNPSTASPSKKARTCDFND